MACAKDTNNIFFLFNKILYVHSFPILYVLLYVMVGVAWEGGGMYTAPEV